MKIKLATACFVVANLLAPLAAYAVSAGDTDRSHPAAFVKDSVITGRIKTKPSGETISSLARVRADTDATGIVLLSGAINSKDEADMAIALARATEGMTSVR